MSFQSFYSKFKVDSFVDNEEQERVVSNSTDIDVLGQNDLLQKSFNNGLYRTFSPSEMIVWDKVMKSIFTDFKDRLSCFGYDWMGRIFALDEDRRENGQKLILMLEPGTGDALEIPANLIEFHDNILLEMGDAALAETAFHDWINNGNAPVKRNECVGYKTPLFLGGEDKPENFELIDMEVYWEITGQIIQQLKDVPEGTQIHIS